MFVSTSNTNAEKSAGADDPSNNGGNDSGGNNGPGVNDTPHALVPLEGKLVINEIGLHCTTDTTRAVGDQKFHIEAGQSYIEIKNVYPGDAIPGYALEQLM